MDEDEDRPLSPLEMRLFGGDTSPSSQGLADLARPFVDRTKLTCKLFRRDYEKIGSLIAKAYKDGQLTQQHATDLYLDIGHVVSTPLIERYLAARECGKIADWLRSRDNFCQTEWLNPRNRLALDGFVTLGEGALAVQLLRQHLHRMMIQTRATWRYAAQAIKERARGAEIPPGRDIVAELPAELDLALLELAECEPYIIAHGAKSDRDALADMREEISRARKRYTKS